jgi:hypothetical protein
MLARVRCILIRTVLCVAGQTFVFWRVGADASRVGADRMQLIESLRPHLRSTDVVAALDIGWVGASFDGTVVDLAGLTDPSIASLPGGHTSKAIPPMLLSERNPNRLVFWSAGQGAPEELWQQASFSRAVERKIANLPWAKERFTPCCVVEAGPKLRYLVLEARALP